MIPYREGRGKIHEMILSDKLIEEKRYLKPM